MAQHIFDDIAAGLNEAIDIAHGRAKPGSYRVHVPSEIDVRAIREALGLTREAFALSYGFPVNTLRDWEQRKARPDTAARAYLLVISREPIVVRDALVEQDNHDTRALATG